jgi:hypothetical protein
MNPRVRSLGGPALFALALACGGENGGPAGPEGPSEPSPIQGRIGEVVFQAQLLQPAWDRLVGRVTLSNPTGAPVEFRFPDTCVLLLRLYTIVESQLVIDAHSKRCIEVPVDVTLAPGESRTFETNVTFFFILGNQLPEGRYRAILYLRPEGRPVVEIAVGLPRLVRPEDESL